jgi:hypothetical protein
MLFSFSPLNLIAGDAHEPMDVLLASSLVDLGVIDHRRLPCFARRAADERQGPRAHDDEPSKRRKEFLATCSTLLSARARFAKPSRRKMRKRSLAMTFESQTNQMLSQFKQNKQAGPALTSVRDNASRIEKLLGDVPLGPQVGDAWAKVKTELSTISDAFKVGS